MVASCWFAFQCAVTVGATVLPVQGGRFVRPSPRSAYTYTPSGASPAQLASPCFGPLGKTPTVTALGTLGCWANGASVRLSLRGKARLLPRAASTVRSAILRRRNTGSSSRARPVAHHANCRRAVPLRSLLTHAPLARPSIRRVFLRSFCARQCSIGSLNFVAWLISAWQLRYNMLQNR